MEQDASEKGAQLGVLFLSLYPQDVCVFRNSSASSLHAALLRRLELFDPDLATALHETPHGAHASDHPWTISPLLGSLDRTPGGQIAYPNQMYRVRLTALVPEVLSVLLSAFDPETSLGREPLHLEHVPFYVVAGESRWEGLATYSSLLTLARPARRISLCFRSPTGFRSDRGPVSDPSPRICLTGYLRKWELFADVTLPSTQLLEYAERNLVVVRHKLRPATIQLGRFYEKGVVGELEWEADGNDPGLLRLVNALVDYASYCGTGMKTAQGMGQTVRLDRRPGTVRPGGWQGIGPTS